MIVAATGQPALSIELDRVSKSFGRVAALRDVSMTVRAGRVIALLGPNGAGKTTTIKILTTLLRPSSGRVRIDGLDPVAQPMEVRRRFGIVFQDPTLDTELTAVENLRLHAAMYGMERRARNDRIDQVLVEFELWSRRRDLVKHYSGGMRRRLEIARGLLHTPRILFLDEPTLGLDPQTRRHLWTHIERLNQVEQVTVFLTTHYMDEAERVAHRIAIIDRGEIVAEGSAAALRRRTSAATLEEAFLALTGTAVRDAGSDVVKDRRRVAAVGVR